MVIKVSKTSRGAFDRLNAAVDALARGICYSMRYVCRDPFKMAFEHGCFFDDRWQFVTFAP